jgi:hypothetical protein
MTKTQFDEKRYIMPELLRYDLLAHEIIDRESHSQDIIDELIKKLPRYNDETKHAVISSIKAEGCEAHDAGRGPLEIVTKSQAIFDSSQNVISGTECVICLEKCKSRDQ